LGKVINYTDYLKAQKLTDKSIKKILVMVDHLHPKIEELVETEIANMSASKEVYDAMRNDDEVRSLFDMSVITSLCFILAQYLVGLANRPNNLNVSEDNLEIFATNLIHGMIKTFERKLHDEN